MRRGRTPLEAPAVDHPDVIGDPVTPVTPMAEAIFVHGLATSHLDLLPVAEAFEARGVKCHLLTLAGHGPTAEHLVDATVDEWLHQLRTAVDLALSADRPVYLVGFSLGASLALRVAAERPVAGVLGVSTFVRPSKGRLAKVAYLFKNYPPIGSRRPRVTAKRTRDELAWSRKIPVPTLRAVIEQAPELAVPPPGRRVLLVHSINDPVASYRSVVELVRDAATDDVRLVSLAGLAHFLQFDVSPRALCSAALEHFSPSPPDPDITHPVWVENLKQREEEVRHWSNILSILFLGFFTAFGAYVNATLSEVTAKGPRAPFYLVSYVLLLSTYLQFVFLYFFYMNRVQVYIKAYLDPFQEATIGWATYRTTKAVSGRASLQMTRTVAFAAAVLPMAMAVVAAVSALQGYRSRFLSLDDGDRLLQLLGLLAVLWLLQAGGAALRLVRYTNVHLYLAPPVAPASRAFLIAVRQLYLSTRPGSVGQRRPVMPPPHHRSP